MAVRDYIPSRRTSTLTVVSAVTGGALTFAAFAVPAVAPMLMGVSTWFAVPAGAGVGALAYNTARALQNRRAQAVRPPKKGSDQPKVAAPAPTSRLRNFFISVLGGALAAGTAFFFGAPLLTVGAAGTLVTYGSTRLLSRRRTAPAANAQKLKEKSAPELLKELEGLRKQNDDLTAKHTAEIEKIRAEQETALNNQKLADQLSVELAEELSSKNSELKLANETIDSINQQLTSAKLALDAARSGNPEVAGKIAKLEEALHSRLEAQIIEHSNKLRALEAAHFKELETVQRENNTLKASEQDLQSQVLSLKQEAQVLMQSVRETTAELEASRQLAQRQAVQLKELAARAETTEASLRTSLQGLSDKYEAAEKELETSRAQLEQQQIALQDNFQKLGQAQLRENHLKEATDLRTHLTEVAPLAAPEVNDTKPAQAAPDTPAALLTSMLVDNAPTGVASSDSVIHRPAFAPQQDKQKSSANEATADASADAKKGASRAASPSKQAK